MPRKPKAKPVDLSAIPTELLEQFGSGPTTAEAIDAATLALKKALIERALGGEMSHHLGYPAGAAKPITVTNQRNGTGAKTVLTEDGPIRIEVPRDRDGSFEPLLISKHERRLTDFDDKIVAMYALPRTESDDDLKALCTSLTSTRRLVPERLHACAPSRPDRPSASNASHVSTVRTTSLCANWRPSSRRHALHGT